MALSPFTPHSNVPHNYYVIAYAYPLSQGSLHDAMQSAAEKDSFTWSRSLKILEHALKGIVGLHSWKPQIVHRDLKSMNLLVDDNWNVKVRHYSTPSMAQIHTV